MTVLIVAEASLKSFSSLLKKFFSSFFKTFLQALLPARCLSCRSLLSEHHQLCAECWNALEFIEEPYCACCGYPFDVEIEATIHCGACLVKPTAFDLCRSAFIYNEASKRLILALKHADRLEGVPLYARLLEKVARPYLHHIDFIIPVPLHWTRLWRRQYNQAALLACALGKRTN